jgi:hypothetical protein
LFGIGFQRRTFTFLWVTELSPPQLPTSHFSQLQAFKIKSQSYVVTYDQSASLSWCQAPSGAQDHIFYYCQTVAGWLMWGALSDERTGLPFAIAAVPRQRNHSRVMTGMVVGMATPDSNLIHISHSKNPSGSKDLSAIFATRYFLRYGFLDPRSTHKLEDNLEAINLDNDSVVK